MDTQVLQSNNERLRFPKEVRLAAGQNVFSEKFFFSLFF